MLWCLCWFMLWLNYQLPNSYHVYRYSADIHAQKCDADARQGNAARCRRRSWRNGSRGHGSRSQTAPVPAVPEEFFKQSSTCAAHTSAHRRKTLQVFLLRPTVQAAIPRAAAYEAPHRWEEIKNYWKILIVEKSPY